MADSIQSLNPNKRKRGPVAERFWAKVAKAGPDECWLWTGSASKKPGYGKFMVGRSADGAWRPKNTHVVAWQLTRGPVPKGLFVCHRCDNRLCVNPDHLFLGTPAENQRDMARKDRSVFGEKAPWAKLKNNDIAQIKTLRREGLSQARIAACFGVTRECITAVLNGKTWRRAQGLALALVFFVAASLPAFSETGVASFYGPGFNGRKTASGERYDQNAATCAHRTAPFGTRLKVTDLATGRSVICRVSDRGPFIRGRIVDLSAAGARDLGIARRGVARVRVDRLN